MILKLLTNNSEFEFLGVYIKGKTEKKFRFLVKDLKLNIEQIFYIDFESHIAQHLGAHFAFCYPLHKEINKVKFKNYNYYFVDNDYKKLESELIEYKNKRKLFPQGSGFFSREYKPTFLFNNEIY